MKQTQILERERTLYRDVWASLEAYGEHAPGEHYLPLFLQMVGDRRGTVLDAGTGSGKGAVALARAGFDVRLCDVTPEGLVPEAKGLPFYEACLWSSLADVTRNFGTWGRQRADWVYCTDVLEHIPPQFTMLAIDQMLRVARHGLFLSVSFAPDNFGVWAGVALHQTVQPFTWWRDALREVGELVEARDLVGTGVFLVKPE